MISSHELRIRPVLTSNDSEIIFINSLLKLINTTWLITSSSIRIKSLDTFLKSSFFIVSSFISIKMVISGCKTNNGIIASSGEIFSPIYLSPNLCGSWAGCLIISDWFLSFIWKFLIPPNRFKLSSWQIIGSLSFENWISISMNFTPASIAFFIESNVFSG